MWIAPYKYVYILYATGAGAEGGAVAAVSLLHTNIYTNWK